MCSQHQTTLEIKIVDGKAISLTKRQNSAMRGQIVKPYYTIDEVLIENPVHCSSSTYKLARDARREFRARTR